MKAPFKNIADAAAENVRGQADAVRFMERARAEFVDADALLQAFLLAQQAHPERARGFMRVIQKHLEREASNAHR